MKIPKIKRRRKKTHSETKIKGRKKYEIMDHTKQIKWQNECVLK